MSPTVHAGWIFHVDLDQFIAAVEVLRRPELRGRPVIVGGRGDPSERAVVATASYEARECGARSGMPLRIAARRCPEAVLLPMDMPQYIAASDRVMAALRTLGVVEVAGLDEAYVAADVVDPVGFARDIRATVQAATGLHCSIGVGDNTVRAKNATDFGKPRGSFMLTRDNWLEVMGPRPVMELWGIGPRMTKRLAPLGITTVSELAAMDPDVLREQFGPSVGQWYSDLGRGIGRTVLDPRPRVARSHSRETTYQQDLRTEEEMLSAVAVLARQVADDCARDGRPVMRLGLKVRYAPFFTVNRSRKLPAPTADRDEIAAAAVGLAQDRIEPGREIRLLGVRGEMVEP